MSQTEKVAKVGNFRLLTVWHVEVGDRGMPMTASGLKVLNVVYGGGGTGLVLGLVLGLVQYQYPSMTSTVHTRP